MLIYRLIMHTLFSLSLILHIDLVVFFLRSICYCNNTIFTMPLHNTHLYEIFLFFFFFFFFNAWHVIYVSNMDGPVFLWLNLFQPSSRFDELPDDFDPSGKLPGSFDDGDPQTTNLYVGNLSPQVCAPPPLLSKFLVLMFQFYTAFYNLES